MIDWWNSIHWVPFLWFVDRVLIATGAAVAFAFVLRYSKVPWNSTPYGRHMMRLTALVAVMLTFTLVFQLVTVNLTLALWIQTVVFVAFDGELLDRHRLLKVARHEVDARSSPGAPSGSAPD